MYRTLTLIMALALALAGCGATGQTQTQGDLSVTLETSPTTPIADQPTTFHIIVSRSGAPLDRAYVTVARQMSGMEHHGDEGKLVAQSLGGGRYDALSSFAMGSRWDVAVAVAVAKEPPQVINFTLDVEQP